VASISRGPRDDRCPSPKTSVLRRASSGLEPRDLTTRNILASPCTANNKSFSSFARALCVPVRTWVNQGSPRATAMRVSVRLRLAFCRPLDVMDAVIRNARDAWFADASGAATTVEGSVVRHLTLKVSSPNCGSPGAHVARPAIHSEVIGFCCRGGAESRVRAAARFRDVTTKTDRDGTGMPSRLAACRGSGFRAIRTAR
jgi:hypothetical protein